MWVGWTRPKIMAVVKGLERIPLIGIAGGFVEGYIPLVDDYFYCKSDDLYIDCVDVIYILLAHLRFISPFCNHLQVS
jgi:hypothetical protein